MNPRNFLNCVLASSLAVMLASCNRSLRYEKTISLGPGDVQSFEVDAPRGEQKVTVSFTSSKVPVNVFVALAASLQSASKDVQNFQKPQGVLGKLENAKEGSIDVVIPAKTGFGVIVAGAKNDTEVQFKMAGK
jgi:hypothetical protein